MRRRIVSALSYSLSCCLEWPLLKDSDSPLRYRRSGKYELWAYINDLRTRNHDLREWVGKKYRDARKRRAWPFTDYLLCMSRNDQSGELDVMHGVNGRQGMKRKSSSGRIESAPENNVEARPSWMLVTCSNLMKRMTILIMLRFI